MTEIIVNGWRVYPHPIFRQQYLVFVEHARKAKRANPENYKSKRAVKFLTAAKRMAFEDIPTDPSDQKFRQGITLGEDYTHWRRGKFLQQFRMFFRFSEKDRVIVLAWVNDEDTKRAYESKSDAYRTFRKMLDRGRPPDDWATLVKEAQAASPTLDDDI